MFLGSLIACVRFKSGRRQLKEKKQVHCVCVCVWKGYGLLNNSGSVDVGERKQGGETTKIQTYYGKEILYRPSRGRRLFLVFWGPFALAAQFGL